MHDTLWSIAGFDFARRLRMLSTWVYLALYTAVSGLWMAAAGGALSGASVSFGDKILINGTNALGIGISVLGFTGIMVIGSVCGRAIQQDFEVGIHHFFFSAPITKRAYFFGRLFGAWLTLVMIFVGVALGVLIGTHWPGVDAARVAASPDWQNFVRPYVFVLIPNILWLGGCFFVLAALTRQMAPVYVAGVIALVAYLFAVDLLGDMDNKVLAAMLDPSGATAVDVLTRYWSVAQKNEQQIPFTDVLLWNRALWVGLGLLVVGLGYRTFRMEAVAPAVRRRARAVVDPAGAKPNAAPNAPVALPVAVPDRSTAAFARMLPGLARLYLGEILRSPRFLTIVLGGVLLVVGNAMTLGSMFGTNTYPLTYKVLDVVSGLFSVFVLIVTAIYTGELVWRERDARVDDITDSMPAPTWLAFGAKFVTVLALQLMLLCVVMVCCIAVQLAHGFTRIELGQYLFELFVLQFPGHVLIAVLALTVHTLVNNKYLGHFAVGVVFLVSARLPSFGFEDKLYLYASRPELVYSDMNGYGHFLPAVFWFRVYWLAFAVLLLVLSYALWVRGRDSGWRGRWRRASARLQPAALGVSGAALVTFVAAGGWIYYNTHVLNPFVGRHEAQQRQADYESRFKRFAGSPQPRITAVDMRVNLYPAQNRARLEGTLTLMNKTAQPIRDVYVVYPRRAIVSSMRFDRPSRLADEAPALSWHHHVLDEALAPAATTALHFDITYAAQGFSNAGADPTVLANGTFLNAGLTPDTTLIPSFGYSEDAELKSDRDRKTFGLPPKERMHDLDDKAQVMQNALSRDADFIDYRAQFCTAADQLPVTSGYVEKDWTERDADGQARRCIAYRMDSKMADVYSFVSARYQVKRDTWQGPGGDVTIEIDYQRGHEYNLDRMIAGVKDSLGYFTTHFGPYQHKIVRIIEFPRFSRGGGFAESFPNTVPFNESIGFTAKVDDGDPQDIDYPYFVTAHEVAHQWWAHQEMPANVQGAEFITESLAEYSALMVLKQKYGDTKMRRFLKYELDRYLQGRGTEQKQEQPLVRADGAAYVHYQKGAMTLYALQDAIGEAAISDALSTFVRRWHFAGPPYPRSLDLLAEFRRVTPVELQPLVKDLFETITLYDVRATRATATKLADGRFEVDLLVSAKQVRADGVGNETEVPFNAPVDIGVLGADGKWLHLEKHAVRAGDNRFSLTVSAEPVRAGIDPLNKLIDRDSVDNVMPVSH